MLLFQSCLRRREVAVRGVFSVFFRYVGSVCIVFSCMHTVSRKRSAGSRGQEAPHRVVVPSKGGFMGGQNVFGDRMMRGNSLMQNIPICAAI